jgi:glucose/arabinose dehydrogenase/mono/diheme cytochrome c family protein
MKSFFWCALLFAVPLFAQRGDDPDETQAPPPASMKIPPSPPLSVEEAMKQFRLQPGFKIEVVASEPIIEAPVEIEFDEQGRMFVLEMRGFMPNVDGKGEDQRVGRISLLEDTNGDGRMDKNTTFAEGLLMPRAICVTRGGLLVAEPPNLWFFRDKDGDGKAEDKELVSSDYGSQGNPEHNANGLLWGRDNWIYSANHTVRYRNIGHGWEKGNTVFRGQWGISQDDYGRLFFNSNSDQLRGDLVPDQYLSRNPNFRSPFGSNVQLARDQSTFPARVNPGVNRGYQKGTLREDGTLAKFTGACGPCIYRGDLLPKKFYGAAFLCEPTANLVRCDLLEEKDGLITATNAFPGSEFLASLDERFRPVNISNGPDGALYIVDMHRGVLQHRIYLTTYLRNQALDRKLETPLNHGRIYRVVAADAKRPEPRNLARMSSSELVHELASSRGWTRDTAQRLLVERHDFVAIPGLERLAAQGSFPSAIHALWTLNGLQALTSETVAGALQSSDSKVRATAVRVAEPLLGRDTDLARKVLSLANDPSTDVQLQVMFTLGELRTSEAEAAMLELLARHSEHPLIRDAAVSGLFNRELPFLNRLLAAPEWQEQKAGREKIIRDLSRCVAESRRGDAVNQLLAAAAGQKSRWVQYAMLDGISALLPAKTRGKEKAAPKVLNLPSEPAALAQLAALQDAGLSNRLKALEPLLTWPGKAGMAEIVARPLTESEKKLFDAGKAQYPLICGACHQPNGLGLDGLAPPLVDSEWSTGSPERVVRIALNGVRGPLAVKGRTWELEMPPVGILPDDQIAALLTYIRREWGHTASPITPEFVAKVRKETETREEAWTEAELLKIK